MPLTVCILGPLEVHVDGAPIALGGARLRTLVSRLALDPSRSVTSASLVDALWADEPPEGAANALQSLISRVRKAVGDPSLIAATPGGYQLAVAPEAVDSVRFEALFRSGRAALAADDPRTARRVLLEALALWRGPALADVADAPFAAAPAARLDELRLAALTDRLDADLRLGLVDEALPELEALTAEHPLRENIAALHVRALYAAGRQADALAAYETVRRTLADQLGIDPTKELAEVHLAVLRSDPTLTPAAPSHDGKPRTNLKARLTSFVGRDEEVARIGKLLETSRLVTLVGPGGAGKTRLAGEAAERVLDRNPDGVWLAELAPVTDPGEVTQAVLSALGPRETRVIGSTSATAMPRGGALGHVIEALAEKRTLLILDNCEHLVAAAAEVAEQLLGHCPGLRIVATSREPLGILGESLLPVPPLALPAEAEGPRSKGFGAPSPTAEDLSRTSAANGSPSMLGRGGEARQRPAAADQSVADTVLAFPAIRLFADRAAAVQPDFAIDAANLADVLQICRRLDGLPLAIELAAARLRTLPVHQIAARLGDRFRLLTGGSRTAMPRHQTLRAVVAWSWELLSDEERDLAERLSVFPGGVTAASAAAVTPDLGPDEAFDLLSALVDKSLLQVVPTQPDEEPRFRMLETLREYGAERLGESGRVADVRRAHARFFRDLAEEAEPHLRRADQLVWLKRLDAERDNILAGLRFAADDEDADTAVRIAAALAWYWSLTDQNHEGQMWMGTALDTPGESDPVALAIVKVLKRVMSVFVGERWEDAHLLEGEIAEITAGLDDSHSILALASVIGPMLGDNQEGVEAAVEKHADHSDRWVSAMMHMMRGMSAENAGRHDSVREDLETASELFTEVGDRWGMSAALNGLATLTVAEGDDATALELQNRALEMIRDINAFTDAAQIQMERALLLCRLGELDDARALLEEILDVGRRNGSVMTTMIALLGLAENHRFRGDTDGAWTYLRQAEADTAEYWHGPPQLLAVRDVVAAILHLSEGRPDAARARLASALRFAWSGHDMPVLARIAVGAACHADAVGDPETAIRLLGAAENIKGIADRSDMDRKALTERLSSEIPEYQAWYDAAKNGRREESLALLARAVGMSEDDLALQTFRL